MRIVQRSQVNDKSPVARIQTVRPGMGEVFYIRALLCHKAAHSWNDLRTVNNILYPSYAEAAKALGLFQDGNEAEMTLEDAVICFRSPAQLRFLFSQLILEGGPATVLWERLQTDLYQDFLEFHHMTAEHATNKTLTVIGDHLAEWNESLSHFGLPEPSILHLAVEEELSSFASQQNALMQSSQQMFTHMNEEQKHVYTYISDGILNSNSLQKSQIFIDGMAGQGKSYLMHAICDRIGAQEKVVMIGGSTALSVQNYERGRTLHNLFHISIKEVRVNIYDIQQLSLLIRHTANQIITHSW
jgi:PIF1-like helicase